MSVDPCTAHPDIDYLFGPLTPETLARMRREASADPRWRPKRSGRPPRRIADLVGLLASGEWVPAAMIALALGVAIPTVGTLVRRARQGGAPIQVRRGVGYRLAREAA